MFVPFAAKATYSALYFEAPSRRHKDKFAIWFALPNGLPPNQSAKP
jgi:hypothetical protein